MKAMHRYANPTRFMALSARLIPWAAGATVVLFAVGLYLALFVAPPDYQQGETVRIMFIHVPAAWMAVAAYTFIAGASAVALIWRHPLADVAAKSAAPVGACFTFLALITGSLWGKPMWGTWWVWDARLTSVLVLFLIYLGYMAVWHAIEEPQRAGRRGVAPRRPAVSQGSEAAGSTGSPAARITRSAFVEGSGPGRST